MSNRAEFSKKTKLAAFAADPASAALSDSSAPMVRAKVRRRFLQSQSMVQASSVLLALIEIRIVADAGFIDVATARAPIL